MAQRGRQSLANSRRSLRAAGQGHLTNGGWMEIGLTTDMTDLEQMYKYFQGKDWKQVQRKAVTKMRKALWTAIRKKVRQMHPKFSRKGKNSKYSSTMIKGVMMSKIRWAKKAKGFYTAVHVMGVRAKDDSKNEGTWRLRFFNGGTGARIKYNKWKGGKKDKLGRTYYPYKKPSAIHKASHFQEKGRQAAMAQMQKDLGDVVKRAINLINDKKYPGRDGV